MLLKRYKEKFSGGAVSATWTYLRQVSTHECISRQPPVVLSCGGICHRRTYADYAAHLLPLLYLTLHAVPVGEQHFAQRSGRSGRCRQTRLSAMTRGHVTCVMPPF